MPNLDDIMGGRVLAMTKGGEMNGPGKHPFYFFCNHILECVAGKKKWKAEKSTTRVSKSCATVSDEAFALLLMVNSWDKFEFMSADSNLDSVKDVVPSTMFTEKKGRNRKLQGWTLEGIDKYNKLCEHVKKDRASEEGKLFEKEFLEYQKGECARKAKNEAEGEDDDVDSDNEGDENEPKAKRVKEAYNHLKDDDETVDDDDNSDDECLGHEGDNATRV